MSMLTIRAAQMEAFTDDRLRQFAVANAGRVSARFPDVIDGMTRDDVIRRIVHAVQRARAHGIVQRRDLEQFIDFEFLCGPEFDRRHPEPARILSRSGIDGSRKMALINDWELFDRPAHEVSRSPGRKLHSE